MIRSHSNDQSDVYRLSTIRNFVEQCNSRTKRQPFVANCLDVPVFPGKMIFPHKCAIFIGIDC